MKTAIPQEVIAAINKKVSGLDSISAKNVKEVVHAKQQKNCPYISPRVFVAYIGTIVYVAKQYANTVQVNQV